LFPTRDGQIALAPPDNAFFHRLADALGEPGLKTDPLYATMPARLENRERINAIVGGKLATNTTAYWVEVLNKAGVPCGPVNTVAEVFRDPQILAQDMLIEVPQPGYGPVRSVGSAVKLSRDAFKLRRHAPALGEHSEEILAEIGYDAHQRVSLRQQGVI
jgi:crotonobetainyl-CoA:carnitine CoA-transferase CaiB-like acyl-CoA transferase